MKKLYYTADRRPPKKDFLEENDGISDVEIAGYITMKQRIESLITAGERLQQARKEAYDFAHDQEVPADFMDPTRTTGFDLSDAHEIKQKLEAKAEVLKENRAELESRKKAEKAEEIEKFKQWKKHKAEEKKQAKEKKSDEKSDKA